MVSFDLLINAIVAGLPFGGFFAAALGRADRGYVIVRGKIAFEGRRPDELNNDYLTRQFYISGCGY